MPDEYIMVKHAVDRSLEEPCVCGGTYRQSGCTIGVSQICVWWGDHDETPVGTVILPQIGELPVHLSLGEVLL